MDFKAPDGRRLHTCHQPTAPLSPLPHNPDIAADAVTGHWAGEPLRLSDTVHALSVIDEARRRDAQAASRSTI